ncbi:DUF6879 family protein [Streptomyces sp. NPDC094448]|uniref:DUF6879 family protein n=1 Tax=Streptomyces sp. NPDC094448 TaxID=3366063 RepID=UPI00381B1047
MKYPVRELLARAQHSAVHLEMRDSYTPDDAEFLKWLDGTRYTPETLPEWWWPWHEIVTEVVGRGVVLRRVRVVSEPVSDYIRYEHDLTFANVSAGEQVRWLPRRAASAMALPGNDFWLFDDSTVIFNHFNGRGEPTDKEITTDPSVVSLCRSAFATVWEHATPHGEYKPE